MSLSLSLYSVPPSLNLSPFFPVSFSLSQSLSPPACLSFSHSLLHQSVSSSPLPFSLPQSVSPSPSLPLSPIYVVFIPPVQPLLSPPGRSPFPCTTRERQSIATQTDFHNFTLIYGFLYFRRFSFLFSCFSLILVTTIKLFTFTFFLSQTFVIFFFSFLSLVSSKALFLSFSPFAIFSPVSLEKKKLSGEFSFSLPLISSLVSALVASKIWNHSAPSLPRRMFARF